jgi:hypothetical protein
MYTTIDVHTAQSNYAKEFNTILDQKENTIYCFLTNYTELLTKNFDNILTIFNTYPNVGCVYTDNVTIQNGVESTLYYPAFSYDIISKLTINTPIFCRGNISTRFNNLNYTIYADFIKRSMNNCILWHHPEILFKIHTDTSEIVKEIKNAQSN